MKASEYRTKSVEELQQALLELRKEQFNLKMQRGLGQAGQTHLFGSIKKDIARIKTVLTEKVTNNE